MKTNVGKTFEMVCHSCQAEGTQSEAAYKQRITGVGPSYQERQRVRVQCMECGEEIPEGHLQSIYIHITGIQPAGDGVGEPRLLSEIRAPKI